MAGKLYAVKIGRIPGIYDSWTKCEEMVKGYPGAVYKSFGTLKEAENYIGFVKTDDKTDIGPDSESGRGETGTVQKESGEAYAFVDGSFNTVTGVYGYGGFLIHDGEKHKIQGSGNDADMASMRNVAGEVLGSTEAVKLAISLGLHELTIYYDYMGIEMWATGQWRRNKKETIAYYEYMQGIRDKLRVSFVKVKGHSGIEGNEEADRLAKEAVGLL